mmetsp:Transcript_5335/g.12627  ORF Transcript_5335/g.12627 Transcript_5335/m.12627 type:complete len:89 (-) Transcript_5335:113-379(-)
MEEWKPTTGNPLSALTKSIPPFTNLLETKKYTRLERMNRWRMRMRMTSCVHEDAVPLDDGWSIYCKLEVGMPFLRFDYGSCSSLETFS